MRRNVFLFDQGDAPSSAFLGSKGANLAVMKRLGLPVPEGFTITTTAFQTGIDKDGALPADLCAEIRAALRIIEQRTGKSFGDAERPLFVSVRSGAPVSMPGMLDTVLNIGLTDRTVFGLAKQLGSLQTAFHTYNRFVQTYARVVFGLDSKLLAEIASDSPKTEPKTQPKTQAERTAEEWQQEIERIKNAIRDASPAQESFPETPFAQLERAILAVFHSWNNPRAVTYRRVYGISHEIGTAVNVQAMVFGNCVADSGTGVLFTRNPSSGENTLYGEFLPHAQGEDLVGGRHSPEPLSFLQNKMPHVYQELSAHAARLEAYFHDMQDIEFTVEKGNLYLLQTRAGKRTTQAAVKIAVNLCQEGLLNQSEAVKRVDRQAWEHLLVRQLDPKVSHTVLTTGTGATPGAAAGPIALDAEQAILQRELGQPAILIRRETDPDDFPGIEAAAGVLTAQGGATSHAAVVTRPLGIPCVVGCSAISIDLSTRTVCIGNQTLAEGDLLTIDGTSGEVVAGKAPLYTPVQSPEFALFLDWSERLDY